MGLFYLLTLYCFIRATESPASSRLWFGLCGISCAAGLCTKEVAVTAPVLVLLYDCAFISLSWRAAWRRHRGLYLALIGTWMILICLMRQLPSRGVGLALGTSPWIYFLTEIRAVAHYLSLAVWPHPLVFDYGTGMVHHAGKILPQAMLLILVLGLGVITSFRWPRLAFPVFSFFLILAPSSSVVPVVNQPMAEHRMYLPLAGLITLLVLALWKLFGKTFAFPVGVLVLVWAFLSWQRNAVYRTDVSLWTDTAASCPANLRSHANLGYALYMESRFSEAQAQLEEALRLSTSQAERASFTDEAFLHDLLAIVLAKEDKKGPALAEFEEALRLNSNNPSIHFNLGCFLAGIGKPSEAISQYQEALRLYPGFTAAQAELAKLRPVR